MKPKKIKTPVVSIDNPPNNNPGEDIPCLFEPQQWDMMEELEGNESFFDHQRNAELE